MLCTHLHMLFVSVSNTSRAELQLLNIADIQLWGVKNKRSVCMFMLMWENTFFSLHQGHSRMLNLLKRCISSYISKAHTRVWRERERDWCLSRALKTCLWFPLCLRIFKLHVCVIWQTWQSFWQEGCCHADTETAVFQAQSPGSVQIWAGDNVFTFVFTSTFG